MTETEKAHFLEGGNIATLVVSPIVLIAAILFYSELGSIVRPLKISVADTYTYVFNLFAIEFGALLSLFGLFACRPTPFLERMKNTQAFRSIVANTNITLAITSIAIGLTLLFALLRIEPEVALTGHSVLFLIWSAGALAVCCVYARTVRLILTALT